MAETVFVRYPDDKDSPDTPDTPNPVKHIVATALDRYRAEGFVQCAENGTPLKRVQPLGETFVGEKKVAGRKDDREAAKVFAEPVEIGDHVVAPNPGGDI